MDREIATADWYALGASVAGSAFDSGLLLARTATTTSLLSGAVLGRAALARTPLSSFGPMRVPLSRPAFAANPQTCVKHIDGVAETILFLADELKHLGSALTGPIRATV